MNLSVLDQLRQVALTPLRRSFGADRFAEEQYHSPPGDPGLFGAQSVAWRVHADPSTLVGGISALMLQSLHPLAMAGVADHSDFRERPFERLGRTASFVAATTFASTEVAEAVIAIVRAVHTHVVGLAPDGRPYAASDPELVRWVHVVEVASFLKAHRRYHPMPVRGRDVDRYFAETAVVAEKLGATDVPKSRAEVIAYMGAIRPHLERGDQAAQAMRFLVRPIGSDPLTKSVSVLLELAAIGLLPPWARRMHGLVLPAPVELSAIRPPTWALLNGLRVLGGSPAFVGEARRRCEQAGDTAAA
ncbi:MAG: oxygenase MpaB family protein [Acidimicrobiales bacterium]